MFVSVSSMKQTYKSMSEMMARMLSKWCTKKVS